MISIIVPTYNSEHTINRCVDSILNIKYVNYELCLVDDGSKDNTRMVNDMYARKYSNIISIHQSHEGVSSARNNGISHIHGKWVCFIDSDDFINYNKFSNVVNKYLSSNVYLIISNINFNRKDIGVSKEKFYNTTRAFLMYNYPLYGNELIHVIWNKIYRTSIIKENNIQFPQNVEMGEDLIFVLRYLGYLDTNNEIIQINISYYNYCIHENSVTKTFEYNALKNKSLILKNLYIIYLKFHLPFTSMNGLKLKAIYSILLNSLKRDRNKIKYLKLQIHVIYSNKNKRVFLLNNNTHKSKLDKILIFFLRQPIIILLIFLYFINFIRKFNYVMRLFKDNNGRL